MTTTFCGKMTEVTISSPGEKPLHMRVKGFTVDISYQFADITSSLSSGTYDYVPWRMDVTMKLTSCETQYQEPSDARRLAKAVLDDDQDAALVLADEVQMSFAAGENYVSRADLLRLLSEVTGEVSDLSTDLYNRIEDTLRRCNYKP